MTRIFLKICLLQTLCSPAFAYEEFVIDDWRTTIDNDTCWMTAHPFDQPSSGGGHHFNEDIRFNIMFPYGSTKPEFSIYTDQIDKHNEKVLVYLGSEVYEFEIIIDHAHSKVGTDRDILFQMLRGNMPMFDLKVTDAESTPPLSVSLSGFKNAYNYISKKCNFHKIPSLPEKLSYLKVLIYFVTKQYSS